MRLSQILTESGHDTEDVLGALSSLVSVLKSKGHGSIPTPQACNYLNSMGHNVDPESLSNIAVQSPFISKSTPEELVIGTDVEGDMGDGGEEPDMVGDMAINAATRDIQQ